MVFDLQCSCGQVISCKDEWIGRKAKFPTCETLLDIKRPQNLSKPTATSDHSNKTQVQILKSSGGSIQTKLSNRIVLNKGSSLQRLFITVIQENLPARLTGCFGVSTKFVAEDEYSTGDYRYYCTYKIATAESLHAVETRFLLFDIWGDHTITLESTDVTDFAAKQQRSFDSEWDVSSENDVRQYFASIAYISAIRTANGKIYFADELPVIEEAKSL